LFARLDTEKVLAELAAEQEAKMKAAEKENAKHENVAFLSEITFDEFQKIDLRACKITACEPIKKAKKLLKLTLDDGTDTPRTVASGIAKWYTPDELVGKTVICVANLKPAVLCGVESAGMILAADCGEDEVKVIFLDSVPAGSTIR
jgi:methionyl-tRNA synthetase